jgi:hypothetical protein
VHYKVRYRDATGKHHSETKTRLVDAERRKAEIEVALTTATWRDPRRGELSLAEWAHSWLPTRLDLRPTTWARLETTMQKQVLEDDSWLEKYQPGTLHSKRLECFVQMAL